MTTGEITFPLLSDLFVAPELPNKTPARAGEHIEIDGECRLYFKADEPASERSGFSFLAVRWVQSGSWKAGEKHEYPHLLDDPECRVDPLIHGWAAFDGVRHAHVGDEGYLHYPSWSQLIAVCEALKGLQKRFCNVDYVDE